MNIKLKVIATFCVLLFLFNVHAKSELTCGEASSIKKTNKQFRGKKVDVFTCVNNEGNINGEKHIYYKNILINKCYYINNILNGKCSSWYFNGKKYYTINYINGNANGESVMWYRNGTLQMKLYYNMFKPVGKWKTWNKKGELIRTWDRE